MRYLCGLLLALSSVAYADSIGSYATGASNLGNINTAANFAGMNGANTISSGTGNTFFLDPLTVWEPAAAHSTWVGYAANAGPLSGVNPPGTTASPEYYTFTSTFTTSGPWTGTLDVAADDTTEVFLNGTEIVVDGALGTDFHCSNNPPNCTLSDNVAIAGAAGVNTLTFVVEQAGQGGTTDDPSGLDFSGTVNVVPEPGTLFLLGTGLVGAAGLYRRRLGM